MVLNYGDRMLMRVGLIKGKSYIAYATAYAKRDSRRIRLVQLLIVDDQGKLVSEVTGDTTIGFYEGRVSPNKIRIAVRSFAKYQLERLELVGDVPLKDIQLKTPVQIEQILSKLKTQRYENLKDMR